MSNLDKFIDFRYQKGNGILPIISDVNKYLKNKKFLPEIIDKKILPLFLKRRKKRIKGNGLRMAGNGLNVAGNGYYGDRVIKAPINVKKGRVTRTVGGKSASLLGSQGRRTLGGKKRKKNSWRNHLIKVAKKHPGLTAPKIAKIASKSYKKKMV